MGDRQRREDAGACATVDVRDDLSNWALDILKAKKCLRESPNELRMLQLTLKDLQTHSIIIIRAFHRDVNNDNELPLDIIKLLGAFLGDYRGKMEKSSIEIIEFVQNQPMDPLLENAGNPFKSKRDCIDIKIRQVSQEENGEMRGYILIVLIGCLCWPFILIFAFIAAVIWIITFGFCMPCREHIKYRSIAKANSHTNCNVYAHNI